MKWPFSQKGIRCTIDTPQDILLWFHLLSIKSGLVTYERLFYKPIEALIFWWPYSKFNFIQNYEIMQFMTLWSIMFEMLYLPWKYNIKLFWRGGAWKQASSFSSPGHRSVHFYFLCCVFNVCKLGRAWQTIESVYNTHRDFDACFYGKKNCALYTGKYGNNNKKPSLKNLVNYLLLIHQIFLLAPDWSKYTRWPNIPG